MDAESIGKLGQLIVHFSSQYLLSVELSAIIYYFGTKNLFKNVYDSGYKFKLSDSASDDAKKIYKIFHPKSLLTPFFNIGNALSAAIFTKLPQYNNTDTLRAEGFIENMTRLERETYQKDPRYLQAMLLDKLVETTKKRLEKVIISNDEGKTGVIYFRRKSEKPGYDILEKTGTAKDLDFVEVAETMDIYLNCNTSLNGLTKLLHKIYILDVAKQHKNGDHHFRTVADEYTRQDKFKTKKLIKKKTS